NTADRDNNPTEAKISCRDVITKRGRVNALMRSHGIKGRGTHGNLIYPIVAEISRCASLQSALKTALLGNNNGGEQKRGGGEANWDGRKAAAKTPPVRGKCPKRH